MRLYSDGTPNSSGAMARVKSGTRGGRGGSGGRRRRSVAFAAQYAHDLRPMKSSVVILLLAGIASGCTSPPWMLEVLYTKDGVTIYRELKHDDSGAKVPLGFRHPFEIH